MSSEKDLRCEQGKSPITSRSVRALLSDDVFVDKFGSERIVLTPGGTNVLSGGGMAVVPSAQEPE